MRSLFLALFLFAVSLPLTGIAAPPADPRHLSLVRGFLPHYNGVPLPERSYILRDMGSHKFLHPNPELDHEQWPCPEGLHVFDSSGLYLGTVDAGPADSPLVRTSEKQRVLFVSTFNNVHLYSLPGLVPMGHLVTMDSIAPLGERGVLYTATEKNLMGRPGGLVNSPEPKSVYYRDFATQKDIPVLTGTGRCDYTLDYDQTDGFTFSVKKTCAPTPAAWYADSATPFSSMACLTPLPPEIRSKARNAFEQTFVAGRYSTDNDRSLWMNLDASPERSQMEFAISICSVSMELRQKDGVWQGAFHSADGVRLCETYEKLFKKGDPLFHLVPVPGRTDPLGRVTEFDLVSAPKTRDRLNRLGTNHAEFREHFNTDTIRYAMDKDFTVLPLQTVRAAFEQKTAPPQSAHKTGKGAVQPAPDPNTPLLNFDICLPPVLL